ncbi:fatty acyl-AMP ligase [Clostridium sp. YIM B02569]|uniref:fatty acyl-AMP ligase n=1 Tax=Clostridium sp. YIM B02569 TaxID=2911967 RepID=UPI001EEC7D29|nr:fatty acyl-AMP ligase [Clostridium sp. YIM B02569]
MNKDFINIIQDNSYRYLEKKAFINIKDEEIIEEITYKDLMKQVIKFASYLQAYECKNQRGLIFLSPSINYIVSFLGLIFAHAIAVPAYTIKNDADYDAIKSILESSKSEFIITNNECMGKLQEYLGDKIEEICLINIDEILASDEEYEWNKEIYSFSDIAYLQYTSGSTRNPKGVRVTYKNIISNEDIMVREFKVDSNDVLVNWLPFNYDMGLIGNILLSLYSGATCVFMKPELFMQYPINWIKAISKYKGSIVFAPNFAYELCINNIKDEDLAGVNLSCLKYAVNGAEPTRSNTLVNFQNKYEKYGLKRNVINACYGLAEATLAVTITEFQTEYKSKTLNPKLLEKGIVKVEEVGINVLSSGKVLEGIELKIVNPENYTVLEEGMIGEIWVAGDSIADGYFNLESETKNTFNGEIKDRNKQYLRTGDLGFVMDNYLYVIGRVKDMIVIRGSNFYPQDIECTVENSDKELMGASIVAFSTEIGNEERLVILAEINNENNEIESVNYWNKIIYKIFENVVKNHKIKPHTITLTNKNIIPKTTSGKIQRQLCKKNFINNTFKSYISKEFI